MKILIIDDEKEDLETMKEILEAEGYDTVTADSGAEALDMVMNKKVNLVLLDIRMPALSGYDILRLLRERLNHGVKMVFISIIPEKEVSMEDVDGFIQKPFSPQSLIRGVKKALKQK